MSVRYCKEAVKIIFMGRDCFDALQEVFKVINCCIYWGGKSALLAMYRLRLSEVRLSACLPQVGVLQV